mmetsp:Transcript_24505/g.40565  ORF Transcript_24505/g.40565 Transcript_24505/m.40565 type:complete len:576 (-) Transcript_24505:417-2144(-)
MENSTESDRAHPPGRYLVPLSGGDDDQLRRSDPGGQSPSVSSRPSPGGSPASGSSPAWQQPPQKAPSSAGGADEEEEEEAGGGKTLAWLFVAMVVFGSLNKIYTKLQCYPMHDFPIFLSLISCAAYVPLCFAYIIPVTKFTDWIGAEQQAIEKHKFMVMGALDAISGVMSTFAVNYITNASMIILVQQSAIPISMAISAVLLQARYSAYQYWGALVVMCGIVVCVLPSLASGVAGGTAEIIWMGVLVLSCVPMCLSSVYKEKALGEIDVDVVYLNGWVAWYQFLITLALAVPSAYAMGFTAADIPRNLLDGSKCYVGIQPEDTPESESTEGIYSCMNSMMLVNMYIGFNVVYNVLLILILKYGSANILWLASTVMVPFGNIVFSLKFVPGHQPLTPSNFWSLGLIMSGLVLYRFYGAFMTWAVEACRPKEVLPRELRRTERQERRVAQNTTKKMSHFVGLNQAEFLEPVMDARIYEDQKALLYRSNVEIRGSFLARLGLPPSPGLTSTPQTRRNILQRRAKRRKQERTALLSPVSYSSNLPQPSSQRRYGAGGAGRWNGGDTGAGGAAGRERGRR